MNRKRDIPDYKAFESFQVRFSVLPGQNQTGASKERSASLKPRFCRPIQASPERRLSHFADKFCIGQSPT
jgi:hypothetical protein